MKKLRVDVGEVSEIEYGEHKGKKEASHLKSFTANTDNITDIKKALRLLKIEAWQIREDDLLFGKIIEKSEIIDTMDKRDEKDRNKYNEKMKTLCQEFNKLPNIIEAFDIDKGMKVEIRKDGEAKYDPHYSKQIQGSISAMLIMGNEEREITPNFFFTKWRGGFRRKRFANIFGHLSLENQKKIKENLRTIGDKLSEIGRKYNLRGG